jgi:hypothetical protein
VPGGVKGITTEMKMMLPIIGSMIQHWESKHESLSKPDKRIKSWSSSSGGSSSLTSNSFLFSRTRGFRQRRRLQRQHQFTPTHRQFMGF